MVRYHYALVDDLISREEFDRRIEQKIAECGNLADEVAAALLVVRDLGRSHVKIRQLRGKSSLFCFYAKIIAFSGVKEFDREGGEKGLVARLTVADETGQVDLVFWDEQAAALEETFTISDVVEVIGRHGRNPREIMPLNLRITTCEIACDMIPKERKSPERRDIVILIISLQDPRPYTRRDGTSGEMIAGIAGDNAGTGRLLSWNASLLTGVKPGMAFRAEGAIEKEGDYGGREFVFDEETVLSPADVPPEVPMTPISDILPDQTVSVAGTLMRIAPAKQFTRRDGSASWVRNLRISDGTADVALVLWDADARRPLLEGEEIRVYHALAKIGRSGDIEISVGRGSCLLIVPHGAARAVTVDGTILHLPDGIRVDNGREAYLVETSLPHGTLVRIHGSVHGIRLFPESEEVLELSADEIKKRLVRFKSSLE